MNFGVGGLTGSDCETIALRIGCLLLALHQPLFAGVFVFPRVQDMLSLLKVDEAVG